jgi:hypothetical protein
MLQRDNTTNEVYHHSEHYSRGEFFNHYIITWKTIFEAGPASRYETADYIGKACGFASYPDMRDNFTDATIAQLRALNGSHGYTLCKAMIARQSK